MKKLLDDDVVKYTILTLLILIVCTFCDWVMKR